MAFQFTPAPWLDDGGLEISEPILIIDDGVECFIETPRRMFVKA
jgi:ectoine hydrolase